MKKTVRFFGFLAVLFLTISAGASLQAITPVLSASNGPVLDPEGTLDPSYSGGRYASARMTMAPVSAAQATASSAATVNSTVKETAVSTVEDLDLYNISLVKQLLLKKGWKQGTYTISVKKYDRVMMLEK